MKLLPRLLAEEDEEDQAPDTFEEAPAAAPRPQWAWVAAAAVVAAIPRLLYLFVFSDPENPGVRRYGDV